MKNYDNKNVIGGSIFLSVTVCLFAPFEMYISNKDEMWFKLSAFWWMPVVLCMLAIIGSCAIGFLFKGVAKRIYAALLFTTALCVYIQGNFLNIDLGVMNGGAIVWSEYFFQVMIRLTVWILIIAAGIALSVFKKDIFQKVSFAISFFLTAVQTVTLLVLLIPTILEGDYTTGTYTFVSEEGLYEMGKEENVIFFCLDMFDDSYFKAIFEEEPEIAEEFEGFTYFSNFTGTYSTTNYSLPLLLTGKTYLNEGPAREWNNLRAEEGTYVDEFINNGYKLGIYSENTYLLPERYVTGADNYVEAPLYITNRLHFAYDLYQLVACKYLPDIVKPFIWMDGTEFNYWKGWKSDYRAYDGLNASFRDGILDNGISIADSAKQFKFIHLWGSHYPYSIDENANDVETGGGVSDIQCARGVIRMVQWYIEEMKKNGSYDNAVIVITADHGYYWDGVLTNPLCLVKPRNATGNMKVNNAPVCQVDLPATIVDLCNINSDVDYGKSMFEYDESEERDRYFYQYYLQEKNSDMKWRLIEYRIDSANNLRESFHLTDVEYTIDGSKIEHAKYCQTCNGEYNDEEAEQMDPPRVVHVKRNNYPE